MTLAKFLTGIGWLMAAWGGGFTIDLMARADAVSSAQWRYLMFVPGGHWSWVGIFAAGALVLVYGLASERARVRGVGYGLLGLGCGAIAAFYIAAPFIDKGLTTLGYWPWLLGAGVMIVLAVMHAKPRPWLQ